MSSPESQVVIRVCREEDVEALETTMPSRLNRRHLRRFRRQQEQKSTYLIAWVGGNPIGHLDIIWAGPQNESVREHLPDCVDFGGFVVATEFRSKGIGTQLIRAAEMMAKDRGFRQACIGVATDNPRARKLYERLGYRDWGHGVVEESWTNVDEGGRETIATGQDSVMVKELNWPVGQELRLLPSSG
jgi:GNAT superfamily N-acetyltransferase